MTSDAHVFLLAEEHYVSNIAIQTSPSETPEKVEESVGGRRKDMKSVNVEVGLVFSGVDRGHITYLLLEHRDHSSFTAQPGRWHMVAGGIQYKQRIYQLWPKQNDETLGARRRRRKTREISCFVVPECINLWRFIQLLRGCYQKFAATDHHDAAALPKEVDVLLLAEPARRGKFAIGIAKRYVSESGASMPHGERRHVVATTRLGSTKDKI